MHSLKSKLAGTALLGCLCSCAQISGLSDLQIGSDETGADSAPPADTDAGPLADTAPPVDEASPPDSTVPDSGVQDDASTQDSAGADSSVPDSAPDAPAGHDAGHDAAPPVCKATAGPALVAVGSFCVDSTEVTNDQYQAFLNASPPLSLAPSPACQFKTSFAPSTAIPINKGTNPVVYVDWCDAYAYCSWAGKHLCGAIGGGPSSFANIANKSVDEWYVACSASGANVYPYGGNTYIQGKCNDLESKSNGTRPVASFTGCQGGYTGLWDMNGNAYEWVDACAVSAGASDSCAIRGGSWFFSGATYGGCNTYFNDYVVKRSDTYNDTGFRCCQN